MQHRNDTAGVIAPPPLIFLGVILLGLTLDWILPAYLLSLMLSTMDRIVLGVPLMMGGAALAVSAIGVFRSADTPVEPWKSTRSLAGFGVFRWLRNPMYVGALAFLAGLSFLLASDWMLVAAIVAAPVIHYGVVLREERYLAAKFGEAYTAYRAAVPRYGLRI